MALTADRLSLTFIHLLCRDGSPASFLGVSSLSEIPGHMSLGPSSIKTPLAHRVSVPVPWSALEHLPVGGTAQA